MNYYLYLQQKKKSYTNVRLKNACIVQKKTRGEHFLYINTRTKVNIQIFHLVYMIICKGPFTHKQGRYTDKKLSFFLFAFPIRCVRELLSFYSSTLIHIFDDDDNKCKKYHHIAHVS